MNLCAVSMLVLISIFLHLAAHRGCGAGGDTQTESFI